MRNILRSSFFWQFAGGFVIGTLGVVAMAPAQASHAFVRHLHPAAHQVG